MFKNISKLTNLEEDGQRRREKTQITKTRTRKGRSLQTLQASEGLGGNTTNNFIHTHLTPLVAMDQFLEKHEPPHSSNMKQVI